MLARLLLFCLLLAAPKVALAQSWELPPAQLDASEMLAEAPAPPSGYVSIPGVYATLHGAPQDLRTLDRLATHAATAIPAIAEQLGLGTGRHVHIYLADDQALFSKMQPGEPPSWADGTAWPARSLIYLRAPSIRPGTAAPLEQVLDHEIAHILLGHAYAPKRVPHWLQEGVAQWVANEITPETTDRLASGVLGGLLSLEQLTAGFPADPIRADLAYAQSADLIAWTAQEHGEDAIKILVREMAGGSHVNAAFREATGMSADELDQEWRTRLISSGLWLKPLVSDTAMWGYGGLLVIAAWFAVRRRNAKTRARWEEEERLREDLLNRIANTMWRRADQPEEPWVARRREGLEDEDPANDWLH